jgi:putrescine---pyruvate transaminase
VTPPRFLHPFTPPAKDRSIKVVRGEGALVWDDEGKEYVDGMASLWFANLGYGRPEVVEAITRQAGTLHAYHCFDPFTNGPAEELAERVAAIAPLDDPRVFFTCSGSEAVDTALKLARVAHQQAGDTQRTLVISRSDGYHGTAYGGTSAQGIAANREGFGPLVTDHLAVPRDDIEAIATVFAREGDRIAAVLTEPVQGAGGVHPPSDGYLPALRRLCDDHGAFLIADEVICGFGRLGAWTGCEHYGVRPDLMTFAKAITSGYMPLGGVVVGAAVRAPLEADAGWYLRHGFTYSGHATACAAGLACLDVTEQENLLDRAKEIGLRLSKGLGALVEDGLYAGLRGDGAMWALVTREDQDPPAVRGKVLEQGVIIRPLTGALAFCPPLVITDEEIDRIIDAVAAAA